MNPRSLLKRSQPVLALVLARACTASLSADTLTFDLSESGGDIHLTVNGSISSLLGAYQASNGGVGSLLRGSVATTFEISTPRVPTIASDAGGNAYNYLFNTQSLTGPASFGTGGKAIGTFVSGLNVGFQVGAIVPRPGGFITYFYGLLLPDSAPGTPYVLGTPITSASVFTGQTFASMGLTAGSSYTWTTPGLDTIQINVLNSTAVPEAGSSVAGLALAAGVWHQFRRRRLAAAAR